MDLKKILNDGLNKVGNEVKKSVTEKTIKETIETVAKKFNISLPDDKIKEISSTIKSKLESVPFDKIDDLVENEIKKLKK